ncbi:MAG: hypothetical protein CVU09_14680 [Bacteroidetes bacterium HGW-Bacteroidetes-4]|jgi:hypothetical protein|nr:MAG: hypothetical protein CVU09_14680 [Bacteroidetes bacterium HGW-Bacteroidetes-4]
MNKEKLFLLLILASITAFVLVPFINTGIVEGDDAEFFLLGLSNRIFDNAFNYARDAGRFYFLITQPFNIIPYTIDNLILIKSINILLLITDLLLVSLIIFKLLHNKWLAFFNYLLLLTFITIKGENNPITSFNWYFTGSFLFILGSIFYALKYSEKDKVIFKSISVGLFALGLLFYEVYLLYLPIVAIASLNNKNLTKPQVSKQKLIYVLKRWFPYILTGIIYLVCYFGFRLFYPGTYSGTAIASSFDLNKVFDTVFDLARGAYPGYFYFFGKSLFWETSDLLQNHIQNLGYLIEKSNYLWHFKAIVSAILTFIFLKAVKLDSLKKVLFILFVAALYIYIPQIPLALTEKYTYLYPGMDNYITTFFAFFAVAIVLAAFFSLVSFINHKIVKLLTILSISLFVGLGSLITDYINHHTVRWLHHSVNTLKCMDKFIETETFNILPENALVYSPQLYSNSMGYGFAYTRFKWGDYAFLRTKKKIHFMGTKDELLQAFEKSTQPLYYLKYDYDTKSADRMLALGPIAENSVIENVNMLIYADSLTCFYYSSNKVFNLSFAYGKNSFVTKTFSVLDKTFISPSNFGSIKVGYHNYRDYFKPIKIKAKSIDMNSLSVSNLTNENPIDIIIY